MGRLTLEHDLLLAIHDMSDGVPGAVEVLAELTKQTPVIDPAAGLGSFHYLFFLDDMGIYGSEVWILFKDVCKSDMVKMIAVLRGRQLGIIQQATILTAIRSARTATPLQLDFDDILFKVKQTVIDFASQPA